MKNWNHPRLADCFIRIRACEVSIFRTANFDRIFCFWLMWFIFRWPTMTGHIGAHLAYDVRVPKWMNGWEKCSHWFRCLISHGLRRLDSFQVPGWLLYYDRFNFFLELVRNDLRPRLHNVSMIDNFTLNRHDSAPISSTLIPAKCELNVCRQILCVWVPQFGLLSAPFKRWASTMCGGGDAIWPLVCISRANVFNLRNVLILRVCIQLVVVFTNVSDWRWSMNYC